MVIKAFTTREGLYSAKVCVYAKTANNVDSERWRPSSYQLNFPRSPSWQSILKKCEVISWLLAGTNATNIGYCCVSIGLQHYHYVRRKQTHGRFQGFRLGRAAYWWGVGCWPKCGNICFTILADGPVAPPGTALVKGQVNLPESWEW